jgi:hypothetical protein
MTPRHWTRPLHLSEDQSVDPLCIVLGFDAGGISVFDPFMSECGRFDVAPAIYYGIPVEEALALQELNRALRTV